MHGSDISQISSIFRILVLLKNLAGLGFQKITMLNRILLQIGFHRTNLERFVPGTSITSSKDICAHGIAMKDMHKLEYFLLKIGSEGDT